MRIPMFIRLFLLSVLSLSLAMQGGCKKDDPKTEKPATDQPSSAEPITEESAGAKDDAKDQPKLEKVELGKVVNLSRFGRIYLAGQLTEEDLVLLNGKGVKTIINLRTGGEMERLPFNEQQAAEAQGMKYHSLPFSTADTLSDDIFARARELLKQSEKEGVILHCAGAVRVGAIWYAKRVLDDGIDKEAAMEEAKEVGLRSGGLIARAEQYVDAELAKRDEEKE